MATYEWPELIGLWRRGELDMEQLTGQALQWGQKIHERVTTCLNKQAAFERQVAACHKRQATLERQVALGQTKQAALEKQVAALLKRVEALEAQLSPKAKG